MDTIGDFLGASNEEVVKDIVAVTKEVDVANNNAKFDDACEYVNDNLKSIIDSSMESLPGLFRVMSDSEDPKMYQVGAAFIKTLSEINKTYFEVNKPTSGSGGRGGSGPGEDMNGKQILINNSNVQMVNTKDLLD